MGGDITGTYQFLTGFYGLGDMPNEFQRVMDSTLGSIPFTNCYLNDILISSKGTFLDHKNIVLKILSTLDEYNFAVKWSKCKFFQKEKEWLGFKISKSGITPFFDKSKAIKDLPIPKNLKELRSFFGSINQYIKFVPNLASLGSPLRPLLNKKSIFQWNDDHTKAFERIKEEIVNLTENTHFDVKRKTRVKTDASHNGLGASLEQLHGNDWKTISFASRFLNPHESKYSTNELELLGVVWAVEYYKNYLYGSDFEIITDHKALLSALSPNHGNKTYHSRLTRWVDRLLPFNFSIKHIAGKDMGFTDLISRIPSGKALPTSHYDEEFVVANINKINISLNPSEKLRNTCSAIGHNLENSDYVLLRNYLIAAVLKLINSSFPICSFNHRRTEFCTSNCIPTDYSNTNTLIISISNSAFLYFLILNCSLINSHVDKKIVDTVNMNNKNIVINPTTSGISVDLEFKLLPNHINLVKKYRENLKLPDRPLDLNILFNAKLVALLTEDDPMLSPIVKALQNKVEKINADSPYFKHFTRDLHESDGLLYMDGKLVIPFTLRNAMMKTLHETHPGQFGMKYLAQYIWWPHINRQIYFHGINCSECTSAGKNIKSVIPNSQISELPPLSEPNEELDLDFAGPLDSYWGSNKYILLCIDRFSKFPSAKITSSTSSKTVIEFLQDYIFLHGIPYSIRVDHATCFTSQDFKSFCDSNNIKIIFCTVGDHRSNGLVEKLVHTVKVKLLAISKEHHKTTLQNAVSKIIWNLRSTFQSKIKCSPFEIHYNRKPNTIWKQLASGKPSFGILDKGKSILSKDRAKDWNADDRIEDGYKDDLIAKKNQNPTEKGYDTDYASSSKTTQNRRPIESPFKGKILRKTNGNINRDCFYKELNKRIINSSTSTVKLSDGKIIRKSDIAIPISTSNKIRPFRGNISFPYFSNPNVEVGQKLECSKRKPKPKKPTKRRNRQLDPTSSDNLTRTRISGPSSIPTRRQTRRSKKPPTPPGYLASDESMLIPSDILDTSEWEWIAGGFPCRDVARERFISDSLTPHISLGNNFNSSITNPEIKSEILVNDSFPISEQPMDQSYECPISIVPASRTSNSTDQRTVNQGGENDTIGQNDPQVEHNLTETDSNINFPVYEISDSTDECAISNSPAIIPGKIPTTIRRSSRNVGPPKFYGKRYFIDAVESVQEASGSAAEPIVLEIEEPHETINRTNPAELIVLDSDSSSSSDQMSNSSTDESLRMEIANFGEHSDLDSELFNTELENFLKDYKTL